ncbi:MAG: hypothetical protein B6241_00175 [Spirochaetaceae bacterium 4572_59]|nr:MAG: hypothetical protein B6241_00175 [Spirochaetaceae bacterium 4572_59]
MKKFLIVFLLTSFLTGIAAADYDWGGIFENNSEYSSLDEELTQYNRMAFWGRGEFSPELNIYAKGAYIFAYDDEDVEHLPDLSAFYLYGSLDDLFSTGLGYRVGRFRFRDPGSLILNSTADGFHLSFPGKHLPVTVGVGFTGLVFIDSSEISMSPADEYENLDDDAVLATPRLIQYVSGRYNDLPGGTSLTFSLIAQEDLRTDDFIEDHVSGSGQLHTQYARLAVSGRFSPDLFYSVSSTLQTGQYVIPDPSDNYNYLAGMAHGSLEYYPDFDMNPLLSLELLCSSGDSWSNRSGWMGNVGDDTDMLHRFTPVSKSGKGTVYAAQPGNLIYADLSSSLKPLETVQLILSSITFFRAVDGPVSDTSIIEASGDGLYLGEELDFTVNWRPYSDLGLALNSGVFFPNSAVIADDDPQFSMGGYFSFSF